MPEVPLQNGIYGHRSGKEETMYRCFIVLIVFLGLLFTPAVGEAEQSGPTAVVKKMNAALLEAMKGGDKLGYSGRYRLLAPVIKASFALSDTARIAAGRYWRTFTEEERNAYLKTYTEWTIASYAGRFDAYSGEEFRLVSESPPARGSVNVISKLIRSDKDEVEFNYRLMQAEGGWRIVDIRISGVSQLALTRGQFVSILGKSGFQGLISMLNGKINNLEKGTGR
jgi:phospholipid transport system substrate-binding protein